MALSKKQLSDLQRIIQSRCVELAEEIRAQAASRAQAPATFESGGMDRADVALADQIADLGSAEVLRDIGELRELEAALARLAAGSFGPCIDCRQTIDERRLYAQPAALRCLACQNRYDHTHVHAATPTL